MFPDANPRRLSQWVRDAHTRTAAEVEPLLFLALLCGTRLWVERDTVTGFLEELWRWLTGAPRRMPRELADVLIEALAPDLTRVVEARGWRFGEGGRGIKQPGRPPEARAAWAAALVIESHLVRTGASPASARELAILLVAVLLGRGAVEPSEFYRARRRLGKPDASALGRAVMERYEIWLAREGVQLRDPLPSPEDADAIAAWRDRHRALTQLLGMYGTDKFARLILAEMPEGSWTPFLDVKPAPTSPARAKSSGSSPAGRPRPRTGAARKR